MVITKASVASDNLAMHAYYIDNEERYICLIYSCSLRLGLTENKSLIGWANKGLHHFDMIKFRERGIQKYDWGGICEDNSNSDELNIRKFKLSFGGSRGEINVFRSFTIYLLEILKEVFK